MEGQQTYDIAPPSWIKQLEQDEDDQHDGGTSPGASASASETEISEISPETCSKTETGGIRASEKDKKGGGRKKKERKKCDSNVTGGEQLIASSINPGTVQETAEEGLTFQCEKYELMRRQYQALRHNYVHLRSRYQQLERRHGKCPLTKRSKKDPKSEEVNLDATVDDMLQGIADGVDEAVTDDESYLHGEEGEGAAGREESKESTRKRKSTPSRKRSKGKAAGMEEEEEENLRTEMRKRGISSVLMLM